MESSTTELQKHQLKEYQCAPRNRYVAASAHAVHALTAGHGVDLSRAEVLDSPPTPQTHCLLENWHIQQTLWTSLHGTPGLKPTILIYSDATYIVVPFCNIMSLPTCTYVSLSIHLRCV